MLQVITLEGWVEIMYYVMDAHSFYNFIYFILLIIVSIREAGALWASSRTHGPEDGWAGGVSGSPQGALHSQESWVGERRRGNFKNAAQQWVMEGTCQGWLPEGSITSSCLRLSFLAFESTPWLLLLFLYLVVPGSTCFLWPAPGAAPSSSLPRALAHPSLLGREDETL